LVAALPLAGILITLRPDTTGHVESVI